MNKRAFFAVLKIQGIISAIIYILYSFSTWTLKNPFQWLIDIPIYENEIRFFGLFFYAMFWLFLFFMSKGFLEENKNA